MATATQDKGAINEDGEDELLRHLERCAEAVGQLSTQIEQVTQRWQARKRYKRHDLSPAFHDALKAMKKLWAFEVDLDVDED